MTEQDIEITELIQTLSQGEKQQVQKIKETRLAHLLADVINSQRLDNKKIAKAVDEDIDIKANRMTVEKSAKLIAGLMDLQPDPDGIQKVVQDLEDQRANILAEVLEEEEYEKYMRNKVKALELIDEEDIK